MPLNLATAIERDCVVQLNLIRVELQLDVRFILFSFCVCVHTCDVYIPVEFRSSSVFFGATCVA